MSGFLGRTYGPLTPDEVRAHYEAWAESYDREIAEAGYATPARIAEALAAHVPDRSAPVLDFGCGTGLSGVDLRAGGFEVIDGIDLSTEMLARARQRGLYRSLALTSPGQASPTGHAHAVAVGVIGPGSAELPLLDALIDSLPTGGRLALSLNDHALADPSYAGAIAERVASGRVALHFAEHGPHLPAIGMRSTVYVIEKT